MTAATVAVVLGATGGIGAAILERLVSERRFDRVIGLSRSANPPLDLLDEASIEAAAAYVGSLGGDIRLVLDATGALTIDDVRPEKSWRQLDSEALAAQFAINAIGPALVMKHFLPLFSKQDRAVFATLSARVGSIGDNHLGGWYGYRASKAALNQLARTAAIELARSRPEAICVVLHPGTVRTDLSIPFIDSGVTPAKAAADLLAVIAGLRASDTGGFFDQNGAPIPW